jgi:hypothetical protein
LQNPVGIQPPTPARNGTISAVPGITRRSVDNANGRKYLIRRIGRFQEIRHYAQTVHALQICSRFAEFHKTPSSSIDTPVPS